MSRLALRPACLLCLTLASAEALARADRAAPGTTPTAAEENGAPSVPAAAAARLSVTPIETSAIPGQSDVTVSVVTEDALVLGSTDLTLLFDPQQLHAKLATGALDTFAAHIDNEGGRITTASAAPGGSTVIAAGASLLSVTFDVHATALSRCSDLTLTDGDTTPPDDLGGPVPPIPPMSIPYAVSGGRVCVAACGSCDDHDHCTADTCGLETTCLHSHLSADGPSGVSCSLANLADILGAQPEPACVGTCFNTVDRRLAKMELLLREAEASRRPRRCEQKLKAAAKEASQLERRVVRFLRRERFAPRDRGERLVAEAKRLRGRARALAAVRKTACARS